LDVFAAATNDDYLAAKKATLARYGLKVYAISNHLTGQCICDDPIDERHQAIVSARTWGDGQAEGVRQRAAEEMKQTAIAARRIGAQVVTGFTGSKIWKYLAMFPPVSPERIADGYADFADRFNPILDVFESEGIKFALEVHPSEIAYDYWTTDMALRAIGYRESFGINFDPSHMNWQQLDAPGFLVDFADRIYHVHCKDSKRRFNGRNAPLGSHLAWGDPRRGWDFVSAGRGDVDWEAIFRTLTAIRYPGPVSVEWEDASMDRMIGAPAALRFVRDNLFAPPDAAFDSAFASH
jgi:sugar phosphate isomerase/epimerase